MLHLRPCDPSPDHGRADVWLPVATSEEVMIYVHWYHGDKVHMMRAFRSREDAEAFWREVYTQYNVEAKIVEATPWMSRKKVA